MEKGIKSKRKILEVAFKLFSAYSYPDVSYSLLEEASGISRGSMVYYFNNKEGIFRAVLETFLFNIGNVRNVPREARRSLKEFYTLFIDQLHRDIETLNQFHIPNLSDARFTIERSALQFVPEFRENQRNVILEGRKIWQEVVADAVASGEIRSDIDAEAAGCIFHNLGRGWLYNSIYDKRSSDERVEYLRSLYSDLYQLLLPIEKEMTAPSS